MPPTIGSNSVASERVPVEYCRIFAAIEPSWTIRFEPGNPQPVQAAQGKEAPERIAPRK